MAVFSTRWKLAVVGVVCYAGFAWYFGGTGPGVRTAQAQEKEKEKRIVTVPRKGESKATPIYFGVGACSQGGCHGDKEPRPFNPKEPYVCRCNEVTIWKQGDKHSVAYTVLDTSDPKNDKAKRARQMQTILAQGDASYKVYEDPRCLACHALVIDPKIKQHSSFKISEGVNCVVCHGAYAQWVNEHTYQSLDHDEFVKLSRKEKQIKKGMIDLWDAENRARLCASCHIGNQAEGKFVTHEMYAAGHPPLPSLEVASFSNEMPRHWQYPREKPDVVLKIQHLSKAEFEQTKLVLVSAAVSLAESMKLLADQSQKAIADNETLDLSNFDCNACHHDLKAPSWRQKGGYPGKPGRVPMKMWPTELIQLSILDMGNDSEAASRKLQAEFESTVAALNQAFSARQYGNTKQIEQVAGKLAGWSNGLATKLNEKACTKKDADRLYPLIPGSCMRRSPVPARRGRERYWTLIPPARSPGLSVRSTTRPTATTAAARQFAPPSSSWPRS